MTGLESNSMRVKCQRRFEANLQGGESAQAKVFAPTDETGFQLKVRKPLQDGCEGNLSFHSGQRSSETEMGSEAECDVTVVLAADVEPVGIGKALRIPVGCAHYRDHGLPLADLFSAHFDIIWRQTGGVLARTLVPQQLFDRAGYEREIISEFLHYILIAQQA